MLTREQILAADDLTREKVEVPEWGGAVYVRAMSGQERDKFESAFIGGRAGTSMAPRMENVRARLAVLTICDEDGKRLFADADVPELGKRSAGALERVFVVAMRLNGIGADVVEELAKN